MKYPSINIELELDAADIADLKLLRQRLTRPLDNPEYHNIEPGAQWASGVPPLTDSERDTDRQLALVERVLKAAEAIPDDSSKPDRNVQAPKYVSTTEGWNPDEK